MEPAKPNSENKFMKEEKLISIIGKGSPVKEEVRVIRNHLLAALIEHTFNLLFVVIAAGYIYLTFGALKYFQLLYAVLVIIFMSPYFILMLQAFPFLKDFYIERYATVATVVDRVDAPVGKI